MTMRPAKNGRSCIAAPYLRLGRFTAAGVARRRDPGVGEFVSLSQSLELRPIEHVSQRSLHLAMSGRGEESQTIADEASVDRAQGVEIRDTGARKTLAFPQGELLRNSSHVSRDLCDEHLLQVFIGGCAGEQQDRSPACRSREVGPP